MNPRAVLVAAAFCIGVALFLDSKRKADVSLALWIPAAWLMILASRPVGAWFSGIQNVADLLQQTEVESPIDRNILVMLMVLGVLVLLKRKLNWAQWLAENPWILLFFLYAGVSTVWSDFPAIAFKRWIRALGALIMILIVLSERDPVAAIGALFRRCTYVLVPFSVILYKYFRSLGVVYNSWTGTEYLIGVTTNKNALGRLCLISALFMLWDVITSRRREPAASISTINRVMAAGALALTVWLLLQSKSSTSLGSFILGSFMLLALGLPLLRSRARHLGMYLVVAGIVLVSLDAAFNLKETAVVSLGRDLTLTDRVYVWQDLFALRTNPVFGVGYDSFWLGPRLATFVRKHQVAEAHSGYIEVYLELGVIGLCLMMGIIVSLFFKAKRSFIREEMSDYGRLRLVMLMIFLIYNVTEAGYKVTTFMAFTLLVVALERPVEERVERVEDAKPAKPATGWHPRPSPPPFVPARLPARSRVQPIKQ